jgi:hypothetical protein
MCRGICEFHELDWECEGAGVLLVFVRVWFGARIMHRFFDHSLAWYWHVMCGHVHLRSQFGIVCERDLLSRFHALVSVKNRVFMLACNAWVMRSTALLCRAKPL